jgi:hypothetical protein
VQQYLQNLAAAVSEAPWLTRERLLLYGSCFALATIGIVALDIVFHPLPGLTNAVGEHLGRDFVQFWTSARLAASGRPEAAYVLGAPFRTTDLAIAYPPIIMLLCWPLAGLSYAPALCAWGSLGVVLFAWVLSRAVGWEMAIVASVGTPAALINIFLQQNGFYTAALLASGLGLVQRRPVSAGILLGMLCCKPQLGMLVPVALAAGEHWRVFATAALIGIALALASACILGPDTWIYFIHRLAVQRRFMESPTAAWYWMPTVFAMTRLLGANSSAAYLAQGFSAVSAALAVAALWRRQCPLAVKSAGLIVTVFLATPYVWDYDAVVLTFAAAWLANEGTRSGFLPWEKITVLILLTLPALSFIPAKLLHLQIAPILLWLSLGVILRRGLKPGSPSTVPARATASQSAV